MSIEFSKCQLIYTIISSSVSKWLFSYEEEQEILICKWGSNWSYDLPSIDWPRPFQMLCKADSSTRNTQLNILKLFDY